MAEWKRKAYARLARSRLPAYFSLVVLLVITMLILPIYWVFTDKLKNQISDMNASFIAQVLSTFDGLLQEVDRTSVRLSENINVNRFIFLEKNGLFDSEEEYQLILKELYGVFGNEKKFYANVSSVYMYIPRTGTAITSDAVMPLDDFPDREYVRTVARSEEPKGWSGVRVSNTNRISGYSSEEEVVTLHRNLSKDGLVIDAILFVDVKMSLFKQLDDLGTAYPHALIVTGADQRLIFAETDGIDIAAGDDGEPLMADWDESKYISSVARSQYNNWTYTIIIPKIWLFAPMQFISRVTFALTLAVLFFGLLASLYFSRRFHKPLEAALARWRKHPEGGKARGAEAESLHGSIQSLVQSTLGYADLLEANRGTIRNAMLLNLLKNNEWPTDTPIGPTLKRKADFYQVITCARDETAASNEWDKGLIQLTVNNAVLEALSARWPHSRFELASLDDNSFSIVMLGGRGDGAAADDVYDVKSALVRLQDQLRTYSQFAWTFGIGNRYEADTQVNTSFQESQLAVQYRIYKGKGSVISFSELHVDDSRIMPNSDQWMKIKDKIIAGIRSRDGRSAEQAVQELCEWIERTPHSRRDRSEWNRIYYIGYSVFTEIEKLIYDLNMDREAIYPKERSLVSLAESNPTNDDLTAAGLASRYAIIRSHVSSSRSTWRAPPICSA